MHNNPQNNANLPLPFPDALQEFRVATSGLTAQNGMHSGASVNAVTKSGTNSFSRQRVRVPPRPAVQRDEPVCRDRPRRQAPGRRPEAQPVRRHARRSDRPATSCSSSAATRARRPRRRPPANIAFVPTAAMLAGDFTAFASPACNGGTAGRAARAVRQQPHQSGALQPRGAEPREAAADDDRSVRPDHVRHAGRQQRGAGRRPGRLSAERRTTRCSAATWRRSSQQPAPFAQDPDNVLTTGDPGHRQPGAVADASATRWCSAPTSVNALRVAFNRTAVDRCQTPFFSTAAISASNVYSYGPGEMVMAVTGGVQHLGGHRHDGHLLDQHLPGRPTTSRWCAAAISSALAATSRTGRCDFRHRTRGRAATGSFNGQRHRPRPGGLPARARRRALEHGGPAMLPIDMKYLGLYAQDTWRATIARHGQRRPAVGAVLRPEAWRTARISNFSMDNFAERRQEHGVRERAGRASSIRATPASRRARPACNKQWLNLSPRVGVAWDVQRRRPAWRCGRRTAMAYDFPSARATTTSTRRRRRSATARCSGSAGTVRRSVQRRRRRSASDCHQREHAIRQLRRVRRRWIRTSTRRASQSWNVTVEQQLGTNWGVSASYLGSYSDRLWGQVALNPGVFLGLGAVHAQRRGVSASARRRPT